MDHKEVDFDTKDDKTGQKRGWREWAAGKYGLVWTKAVQITKDTGEDFKW